MNCQIRNMSRRWSALSRRNAKDQPGSRTAPDGFSADSQILSSDMIYPVSGKLVDIALSFNQ
jgi:hypothetical protein